MKISIEKQLEENSRKEKENFENADPVKDVKLLIEGDSIEDQRILSNLSNKSQFTVIQERKHKNSILEKKNQIYNGKVYTINQIKKLAIDYNLRFLESKHYTGSFDVEVSAKLKEFAGIAKEKTVLDEYSLKNNFYILAPESMFEIQEVKIPKKQLDPLIFYKIDDDHYRLIHKWGNDFTVMRYLKGFRWRGYYPQWLFNTFMVMPFVSILMAILIPFGSGFFRHPGMVATVITFLSIALSFFLYQRYKLDSNMDIRHSYFSPYKWHRTKNLNY